MLPKPCLAGEGAINSALSQESYSRPSGCQVWGCSCPGTHSGPRDLFILKQSPYRVFFQCPLYFLVSYLHKHCGTVGCSLCSSVGWLGVSPMCRGKWTLFPPISPPSFSLCVYGLYYVAVCSLCSHSDECFYINGCWILSNAFSASIDMVM